MTLAEATPGQEVIIHSINTSDEEIKGFLFRLGCYSGEPVTVVSRKRGGYVVSIKNARYNIDEELASAIAI